jgi:hypothetical protein
MSMEASFGLVSEDHSSPSPSKILFGRFMLPDQTEHACSVVGIDVTGAEFRSSCLPPYGQTLIAYLEQIGRIECVAQEATPDGFRVEFVLTGARKERFLTRQKWLISKTTEQVQEERLYNRRQMDGAQSRITLLDGRSYPCEIVDISVTGAAVAIAVLPAIGSKVYLGKMQGKIVRYVETGIALQFMTALSGKTLADVVDGNSRRNDPGN